MHQAIDPITFRQVLEYIEQTPSTDEALRHLAELRDNRSRRMTRIYEQLTRALDFISFQTYARQYREAWYEIEVNDWIEKMNEEYQILLDEHNALQAGIDRLSSV